MEPIFGVGGNDGSDNSHRHRISQDPPPMVSGFHEAVFGRGVLVLKISRPLIGHDTWGLKI